MSSSQELSEDQPVSAQQSHNLLFGRRRLVDQLGQLERQRSSLRPAFSAARCGLARDDLTAAISLLRRPILYQLADQETVALAQKTLQTAEAAIGWAWPLYADWASGLIAIIAASASTPLGQVWQPELEPLCRASDWTQQPLVTDALVDLVTRETAPALCLQAINLLSDNLDQPIPVTSIATRARQPAPGQQALFQLLQTWAERYLRYSRKTAFDQVVYELVLTDPDFSAAASAIISTCADPYHRLDQGLITALGSLRQSGANKPILAHAKVCLSTRFSCYSPLALEGYVHARLIDIFGQRGGEKLWLSGQTSRADWAFRLSNLRIEAVTSSLSGEVIAEERFRQALRNIAVQYLADLLVQTHFRRGLPRHWRHSELKAALGRERLHEQFSQPDWYRALTSATTVRVEQWSFDHDRFYNRLTQRLITPRTTP